MNPYLNDLVACNRANFYGLSKGKGIKNILFFAPINDSINSVD